MSTRHPARLIWAWVAAADADLRPVEVTGFTALFDVHEDRLSPAVPLGVARAGETGVLFQLVPVSAYAPLPPRRRPPAYCPVCRERVWLKLGGRMRHHYAHRSGSACSAASGEGALHLAAKLHLAEQLATCSSIQLEHRCHGAETDRSGGRCRAVLRAPFAVSWDEVRIEGILPAARADVLLLHQGRPVGAVEVFASNPVDARRAANYEDLSLAWIEVPAADVLGTGAAPWSVRDALPVVSAGTMPGGYWRCPRHERLHSAWLDDQQNGEHPLARRVVHIYRADAGLRGGERRVQVCTFVMVERRDAGALREARLEREDTGSRIGRPVRTPDREEARHQLHLQFSRWARWMAESEGAVIDSPMRWMPDRGLPERPDATLFPERLRWDAHTGSFVGAPELPRLAWPRLRVAEAEADPVLGVTPCYWTALAKRDRGPELNAILGDCWIVLRPRTWQDAERTLTRAEITLFHHTGVRWESIAEDATDPLSVPSAPDAELWHRRFRELADALLVHRTELAGRELSLKRLVESVLSSGDGEP